MLASLVLVGCADTRPAHGDNSIAQSWSWKPSKGTWEVTGELLEPANVSAIASVDGQSFMIGSDDLSIAQHGTINRKTHKLSLLARVPLFKGEDKDEIDIEGIAAAPPEKAYYVTGSHSLTKKGKMTKERRSVFRVLKKGTEWDEIDRKSLQNPIRDNATLQAYWEKPLQQGGINIEGLAWKEGQLYFGFRSPNLKGHALVLQLPAEGLFKKGKDKQVLHHVPLGSGLGIRELVAIREGFLIIAGNAGDAPTPEHRKSRDYTKGRPYGVYFWDPECNSVKHLAILTRPGRPEAMLVLADSAEATEVLILFDGVNGGSPMAYSINKG